MFVVACRRLDDVPVDALPWLLACARRMLANQRRGAERQRAVVARLASAGSLGLGGGEPGSDLLLRALAQRGERDREWPGCSNGRQGDSALGQGSLPLAQAQAAPQPRSLGIADQDPLGRRNAPPDRPCRRLNRGTISEQRPADPKPGGSGWRPRSRAVERGERRARSSNLLSERGAGLGDVHALRRQLHQHPIDKDLLAPRRPRRTEAKAPTLKMTTNPPRRHAAIPQRSTPRVLIRGRQLVVQEFGIPA